LRIAPFGLPVVPDVYISAHVRRLDGKARLALARRSISAS
jgi:hypothetical protein